MLLFSTLLLTACTTTKTLTIKEVVVVKQEIPSELLVSSELPAVPTTATKQSEVAAYLVDVWNVAVECKSAQAEIKKIVEQ
ncbi:MAG: hypothetical protein GQ570_15210 [Helicobacteraceae bacterium]|nr:hypothetical protein [Helicobacteraceae bacterium]